MDRIVALTVIGSAALRWRDARRACLDRIAAMDVSAGESAGDAMAELGTAESHLVAILREYEGTAALRAS